MKRFNKTANFARKGVLRYLRTKADQGNVAAQRLLRNQKKGVGIYPSSPPVDKDGELLNPNTIWAKKYTKNDQDNMKFLYDLEKKQGRDALYDFANDENKLLRSVGILNEQGRAIPRTKNQFIDPLITAKENRIKLVQQKSQDRLRLNQRKKQKRLETLERANQYYKNQLKNPPTSKTPTTIKTTQPNKRRNYNRYLIGGGIGVSGLGIGATGGYLYNRSVNKREKR
jgi:hypothetical protein